MLDLERGQLGDIRPLYWQTDTSVSNKSWGYIKDDTFKSPEFVIHQLIDIVSKNGNLLMNIGPRSDGTIPDEVQCVLLDVGEWLNGHGWHRRSRRWQWEFSRRSGGGDIVTRDWRRRGTPCLP